MKKIIDIDTLKELKKQENNDKTVPLEEEISHLGDRILELIDEYNILNPSWGKIEKIVLLGKENKDGVRFMTSHQSEE